MHPLSPLAAALHNVHVPLTFVPIGRSGYRYF